MTDCMPKEQYEFVTKVKNDMLINTNMNEDEAWNFGFRCWQMGYAKVNKRTNADRIRAMSEEELAEFLCGVYDEDECWGKHICGTVIPNYDEVKIAEWLKTPAED